MPKRLWRKIPPPKFSRITWFVRYLGSAGMGVVALMFPGVSINEALAPEAAAWWAGILIVAGIGGAAFVFSTRFMFERLFLILLTGPWSFYAFVQIMFIISNPDQYGKKLIVLFLVLSLLISMFDRYVRIYGWDELDVVLRSESR